MSDYIFNTLNDKEFETLANDLYSALENTRVERFKPGKDGGIDGRFYIDNSKFGIIQSKHWIKSGIKKLLVELEKNELPKVQKINPRVYILFTSLDLSPANKKSIYKIFSEYMRNESDIFGCSEINELISRNPDIEKKHYKLWISSTNVLRDLLERSKIILSGYVIKEALLNQPLYVRTANHINAIKKLESLHSIIITGEPGVGKTTLAEQISLEYFSKKYEFINISETIEEAYSLIEADKKQIFYFDDFLGSNYLIALSKNEDSKIVRFMNIARRNEQTRFILTSRTSIYNQGLLLGDKFFSGNVQNNEYELNVNSITLFEKAQILYNRIWHSRLSNEYIDRIYENKNYHKIIRHRNYSPRLIEYLTDINKLEKIDPNSYWDYIVSSLDSPRDIWDHPFRVQLGEEERLLVLLVSYNGVSIDERDLKWSFSNYMALSGSVSNLDLIFRNSTLILTKSFLVRFIEKDIARYKLANPSISDYVFSYYNDVSLIVKLCIALQSVSSINLIASPGKKSFTYKEFVCRLLYCVSHDGISRYNGRFLIVSIKYAIQFKVDLSRYLSLILELVESVDIDTFGVDLDYLLLVDYLSVNTEFMNSRIMNNILSSLTKFEFNKDEFAAYIKIYKNFPLLRSDEIEGIIQQEIKEYLKDNLDQIISDCNIIDNARIDFVDLGDGGYDIDADTDEIRDSVISALHDEISEMEIEIDSEYIDSLADSIDYDELVNDEIEARSRDGGYDGESGGHSGDDRAIDDLFERT